MNQRLSDLERGAKAFAPRAEMKWITIGDSTTAGPYRISRGGRNHYIVWSFVPGRSGCLAHELMTLAEAKAIAEAHSRERA